MSEKLSPQEAQSSISPNELSYRQLRAIATQAEAIRQSDSKTPTLDMRSMLNGELGFKAGHGLTNTEVGSFITEAEQLKAEHDKTNRRAELQVVVDAAAMSESMADLRSTLSAKEGFRKIYDMNNLELKAFVESSRQKLAELDGEESGDDEAAEDESKVQPELPVVTERRGRHAAPETDGDDQLTLDFDADADVYGRRAEKPEDKEEAQKAARRAKLDRELEESLRRLEARLAKYGKTLNKEPKQPEIELEADGDQMAIPLSMFETGDKTTETTDKDDELDLLKAPVPAHLFDSPDTTPTVADALDGPMPTSAFGAAEQGSGADPAKIDLGQPDTTSIRIEVPAPEAPSDTKGKEDEVAISPDQLDMDEMFQDAEDASKRFARTRKFFRRQVTRLQQYRDQRAKQQEERQAADETHREAFNKYEVTDLADFRRRKAETEAKEKADRKLNRRLRAASLGSAAILGLGIGKTAEAKKPSHLDETNHTRAA